jgi:hypothetical protein
VGWVCDKIFYGRDFVIKELRRDKNCELVGMQHNSLETFSTRVLFVARLNTVAPATACGVYHLQQHHADSCMHMFVPCSRST